LDSAQVRNAVQDTFIAAQSCSRALRNGPDQAAQRRFRPEPEFVRRIISLLIMVWLFSGLIQIRMRVLEGCACR
jgi:hypothetical protein